MRRSSHHELATQDDIDEKEYTVDEALTAIGMGKFQYKILIVTGMIWGADAIEIMILTFLLPILSEEWDLNDGEDGTIGAVVFGGMLIGAVFWPQVSDRQGRRKAVIMSNIGQIIFGMLSAVAWNVWSIMILRFITGFCLGASSCSFTLYAEFAPASDRGKLLILQQSFWAFGAFFNSLLAWLVLETLDWRWYLIISSLPLILIVYLAWKLPESVQYLVAVGERDQAQDILRRAAVLNKCKDMDTLRNLKLVQQPVVFEKRGNPMEIFDIAYFHTTVTCMVIMIISLHFLVFLCALSRCCITFAYYGVSFLSERFFDQLGSQSDDDDTGKYWKIAVTTSSEIPGVLVAMLTLDRIGRKWSMMLYFGFTAVSCFCLIDEELQNIEPLSVTLVFVARGCASIAFFVVYIYFSEYYPTQVRNTALGLAASLSRISGMSTTYLSQSDDISYSFFLLGLASSCGFVATSMLQQDTTGVDLSAAADDMMDTLGTEEKPKMYAGQTNVVACDD